MWFGWVSAFLASTIWGGSFVLIKTGLGSLSPLWLNTYRYGFAILLGLLGGFAIHRKPLPLMFREIRTAWFPGLVLGSMLILQTAGLKETSVMNSSFLTSLHVVMVPVLMLVCLRKPQPIFFWFLAVGCVGGIALLTGAHGGAMSRGDLLTIGCAFLGAVHIVVINQKSKSIKSVYMFNLVQTLVIFLLFTAMSFVFEQLPVKFNLPMGSWVSVGYLAFLSTLVAFSLQIISQKYISATSASIIFLLEAPIAATGGWIMFRERLTEQQVAGALVLLLCSLAVVFLENRMQRAKSRVGATTA